MKFKIDKADWKLVKLCDVVTKKEENDKENAKNMFDRFLKVEHMDAESLHIKRWASQEAGDEINPTFYKVFRKGQMLFPTRNPHLRRAALASFDGVCGEKTLTLESIEEMILPEFLPFLFHSDSFYDHTTSAIVGSTNPHCRWRDVANYEFLIPPKGQQAELSKLLWSMDEVIEKELAVLEKVETLFLSTSKKIFKEDGGDKKQLKDIAEIIMGQSPAGNTYNESGEGIPFLQGNAEFGALYPSFIKYTTAPKKMAPKDSILFSVRAPVGDLNIADQEYCIGRGLAAIVIDDPNLRKFIYNFLKFEKSELERNSTGSTFKSVNKDVLSSLTVAVSKDAELNVSIDKINSITKSIDYSLNKIDSSKTLQKSIINQVF
ncbi:restriction endonuclease subunit S [Pseudoalteromonas sp. S554]|uniref:restriction endonuclease subunit S n=1 Tax=Pseudoalteromonas sp. S554 TaxID=2066516 RepID=UPI00110CEFF5|nr:restriction endonuclease subunit S [Pseudoalteromonas sp. S554]TMS82210.1 hypothetical protein CWB65_06260 [Pseudoalteromonas sp. S554]